MANNSVSTSDLVYALLDDGVSREEVEARLQKQGHDERFAKEMVKEVAKLRTAKRMASGLVMILVGAVVCLASCICTIMSTFSHPSFAWMLYGLTTVGIIIIFTGRMRVF